MRHPLVRLTLLTVAGALLLTACSSSSDHAVPAPSLVTTPPVVSTTGAISSTVAPTRTVPATRSAPSPTPSPKVTGVTGDGWTQVYREDFGGSALPAGWVAYNGPIASTPGATWSNAQVSVRDGALHLATSQLQGQWYSGGVMNGVQAQRTYGKYEVRFRIQKAPGVMYALLLWPKSENWPVDGEIDFAEDRGGNRSLSTASLHWGTLSDHHIERKNKNADFSEWHTAGVEWTPGRVVFTLDGHAYGTLKTVHAPKNPMNLALQTVAQNQCAKGTSCVTSTTPASILDVDWVTVYARS